jgi:type IV secretory pathway VirB10-like protein
MSQSDDQALEALEEAPKNSKRKKIPLWGRVFSAFYQLPTPQKLLYLLMLFIVVVWFYHLMSKVTGTDAVIIQQDVITDNEDAAGSDLNFGGGKEIGATSSDFIAAKNGTEQAELEKAKEEKTSMIQGVTFADWEDTAAEEDEPEVAYRPTPTNTVKDKQSEPSESEKKAMARIYYEGDKGNAAFEVMMARLGTKKNDSFESKTTWPTNKQVSTAPQNTVFETAEDRPSAFSSPAISEQVSKKRGLLPGDSIPCFLEKSLDSTISTQVNCNIRTGVLKGGRFVLRAEQKDDYLILTSSSLVYGNNYGQPSAIAGPNTDVAMSGVRDRVDYHTLYRWSALLIGGAGEAVWEIVSQPNQTVVTTGTSTSVTSGDYDDKDLILGALSRPASIASQAAINEFNKAPTVYADQYRLIYVVMTTAFDAQWLPNINL